MEWSKAISGCAAAVATQTGKLGYLGALINFETRRLAVATYLGAKYCYEKYAGKDPADLEFIVTWIGFWFNIPGVTLDPTAEANAFFDSGVDVVISGIDTTEGLVVASQRTQNGETVFAMSQDNPGGCGEAPEVCLGSPYYNWYPMYAPIVEAVRDGTWEASWTWVAPDFADINDEDTSANGFAFGDGLTEEQKAMVEEFIAEQAAYGSNPANADTIFLWEGPLNLQDGAELAAEGEKVELLDIWYLEQLLEGMTGASSSE
jgi:simple sugar transport system substrate-binding protein